jgi:hypothetical protein
MNEIQYFFYGDVPVVFIPQADGGLRVLAFQPNAHTFTDDRSYWRLIEFDRDDLARQVTLEEIEATLRHRAIPLHLLQDVIGQQQRPLR